MEADSKARVGSVTLGHALSLTGLMIARGLALFNQGVWFLGLGTWAVQRRWNAQGAVDIKAKTCTLKSRAVRIAIRLLVMEGSLLEVL
jgi:hypothetical protein